MPIDPQEEPSVSPGMPPPNIESESPTGGLPISPSLAPTLEAADLRSHVSLLGPRALYISMLAMLVGVGAAGMAWVLVKLIWILTNISFYGHLSAQPLHGPLHVHAWVIGVPVVGAIIIGLIARFGSRDVAGHGIPEAMEQVLVNQSRIPPKMTFLKPLSAAISIGTGGPYGAEGPIIATGGALGSLLGQILSTTAAERKVLLAAGAAAGIAAAFNAPVASILLAVELLLFEFRPRSLVPVALACVVAAAIHIRLEGAQPFFTFGAADLSPVSQSAALLYMAIGAVVGVGAVILTHAVHWVEYVFEHIPIHWMWHSAIGAIAVGVIGYYVPRTFGSGYFNIDDLLSQKLGLSLIAILGLAKFASWTISLGSGAAGGTLAPVFTIGGALGAVLGIAARHMFPHAGLSVGMAALVGMVGIFAGASRALLTSIVFAFETTLQPYAVLPALGGCVTAYMVSCFLMRHSIMTVKMERQGVRVPAEFEADVLSQIMVSDAATHPVISLKADDTLSATRQWIASGAPGSAHQGYPLLDGDGNLVGVLTRRDLLNPAADASASLRSLLRRMPSFVYSDATLRTCADHMARHNIGRLPVLDRMSRKVAGIITRGDLLAAQTRQTDETNQLREGFIRRNGAATR